MKTALHQYLASKTSVTTLVPAASIVRGMKRPAGTSLPCVTYDRVSEMAEHHQGGASSLAMMRIQLTIWAGTDPSTEAIREALRNQLDGMTNTTIGTGDDAKVVSRGDIENSTDTIDWPEDGSDPATFSCTMDWVVWYHPTVPTFS